MTLYRTAHALLRRPGGNLYRGSDCCGCGNSACDNALPYNLYSEDFEGTLNNNWPRNDGPGSTRGLIVRGGRATVAEGPYDTSGGGGGYLYTDAWARARANFPEDIEVGDIFTVSATVGGVSDAETNWKDQHGQDAYIQLRLMMNPLGTGGLGEQVYYRSSIRATIVSLVTSIEPYLTTIGKKVTAYSGHVTPASTDYAGLGDGTVCKFVAEITALTPTQVTFDIDTMVNSNTPYSQSWTTDRCGGFFIDIQSHAGELLNLQPRYDSTVGFNELTVVRS